MRSIPLRAAVVLLQTAAATALSAQDSTTAPAPVAQARNCEAPEHRQFDFWVGVWEVINQGKKAGVNRITKEEQGCLIREQWTGLRSTGQSMNFYDRLTGQWHQVWIDNSGDVLTFRGKYADRRLNYTGESRGEGGKRVIHELTFFNNADGTVRQFWRASEDNGRTWETLFDGHYRRKAGSAGAASR
jgi:hypothetical protein